MQRTPSLNVGLGIVLALVGTKTLVADWWKVPVWVSLPLILGLLGGTALASWLRGRRGAERHPSSR